MPLRRFVPLLLALVALLLATSSVAREPSNVRHVRSAEILDASALRTLEARLERAVFRAEASHLPPEPYRQDLLRYDGAVVAVADASGETVFLTTAAWLTSAQSIALLAPDLDREPIPLALERLDTRFDLAVLRPASPLPSSAASRIEPLEIASETAELAWILLSPGTPSQELAQIGLSPAAIDDLEAPLYWATTATASNGYAVVDGSARLLAVHTFRSASTGRGQAVGWPVIAEFLTPPDAERAPARAPDRTLETVLPRTGGGRDEQKKTRSEPRRYRFGGKNPTPMAP